MVFNSKQHLERQLRYNPQKPWALSIIDPNRDDNDITSGTSNIELIQRCFSDAYHSVQIHLYACRSGEAKYEPSILSLLFAGDYSVFEKQRNQLKRLYDQK